MDQRPVLRLKGLAAALDHAWTCIATLGQLFGCTPGGDLVHLLAELGLVDRDLHDQVDDVAGDPVKREA